MEKSYYYRQSTQYLSFFLPALLMVGVFVWGIYGLVAVGPLLQYQLACIVMPILILSTFIGLHNPTGVKVTDTSIVFQAFGLKHEYKWKDVHNLKIKRYPLGGSSLISIGRPQLFGGRYWVRSQIDGYEELIAYLAEKSETISKKSK